MTSKQDDSYQVGETVALKSDPGRAMKVVRLDSVSDPAKVIYIQPADESELPQWHWIYNVTRPSA